jgi:hypothetical protein
MSSGTATRARSAGFTLPAGGKTGTTDDLRRRLVHRLHAASLDRRLVRLDHPAPIMREGFGGTVAVPPGRVS